MIPDLGGLGDPSERAKHMNALRMFEDIPDFSLVLGGPLYQLFRRAHLSGDATQLVHRRILAALVITWLPLLILSLVSGFALGTSVRIPFLHDLETQVRFLVAVPLLLLAEPTVQSGTIIVVRRFLDRRLVAPEDLPAFKAAVDWGMRMRNSLVIEIALIILVWTAGQWIRSNCRGLLDAELVRDSPWHRLEDDACRLLGLVHEHSDLSVPAVALVCPIVHLVRIPVARVEADPAPDLHAPRSNGRALVLGKSNLRVRADPVRSGGAALGGIDRRAACGTTARSWRRVQAGSRRPRRPASC